MDVKSNLQKYYRMDNYNQKEEHAVFREKVENRNVQIKVLNLISWNCYSMQGSHTLL